MSWTVEFPLVGPAGERIDLRRLFLSHGVAALPPMRVDDRAWTFEVTLAVPGARPRTVGVGLGRPGHGTVTVYGPALRQRARSSLWASVRAVLSLDLDLSPFYQLAETDPALRWAAAEGAGRMIRGATVFEDVVKTVCTTNCSWSATTRMVGALVEHLGQRAIDAPPTGSHGRAFPTAEAMARARHDFYRTVVRAGYRGPFLKAIAASVAEGRVDLEALGQASPDEVPDAEVMARLQALPGVGPYAAAHIGLMLGRTSSLILDSWTRPTYARLNGGRPVKDRTIERRFKRYGRYAGLAFWLFLTREWIAELAAEPSHA